MNLDLQWTQTADQVIIKDVPLPYDDVQGIEIKLTAATIRVVDKYNNSILQGITCGSIQNGSYQLSHPGFIDIFLVKEEVGKNWSSLFREEPDPGVYISEVVAIGNYTAEEPIELTIKKGDTISVIAKDETGWWKGKLNDKVGFFPSNYVKEYPSTPQAPPGAAKKTVQPAPQGVQPGQVKGATTQPRPSPGATGAPVKASVVGAQPKVATNPQPQVQPQPTAPKTANSAPNAGQKRPPSASEVPKRSGPKIPISETLRPRRGVAVDVSAKSNLVEIIGICKTKFEYKANDPNELSFEPGEYIYVISKDGSGWWKGESSTNLIGWFSSAYVEELDDDTARQMFELNLVAELNEPVIEEPPKPAEKKRTFSASMRENPRKSGSPTGSTSIELKGVRTSGIQIHNPQPLNTSGTVKKDLEPQTPPRNVVEQVPTQIDHPVSPAAVDVRTTGAPKMSGSHRNSGGSPTAATPEVVVASRSTTVEQQPNPVVTAGAVKNTVVNPAPVTNVQPKINGKVAAISAAMQEVYNSVKAMKPSATWQKCASDPYLGLQDVNRFSASFCSVTGEMFSIGDSHVNFPMSDIAWPLLFLMMREKMAAKVSTAFKAKEPTAYVVGVPDRTLQNPFYFPGAYTMCSWLTEMPGVKYQWERISAVLNYMSSLMQGYDAQNNAQFVSSKSNNTQLKCCMADYLAMRVCFGKVSTMGTFLKEQNTITTAVDAKEIADIFNQVHSIEANTDILALIAANLANNGTHITAKNNLAQSQAVDETLSFMSSCGLNNDSKDWQSTVGLPAKSSQAGVIMAVIPNVGGLVVYSPPLNMFGNSAKGTEFFKQLTQKLPELKK